MIEADKPPSWREILRNQRGVFLGTSVVFTLLSLLIAAIVFQVTPCQYKTRGVFEALAAPGMETGATDPATVSQSLRSESCLGEVVQKLELVRLWNLSHDDAIRVLRAAVSTTVLPGTRLIEIQVQLGEANQARDVARALPSAWAAMIGTSTRRLLTERMEKAHNARTNHEWAAKDAVSRHEDATRETSLAQVIQREELQLQAQLETLSVQVRIHDEPAMPRNPVDAGTAAFFWRWSLAGMATGLLLAIPASALAARIRRRSPLAPDPDPSATPDAAW